MRQLTLDETWERCLRMWRWIVKELEAWPLSYVGHLKQEWVSEHDPEHVDKLSKYADCYFCLWQDTHSNRRQTRGEASCSGCPGAMVDPDFCCMSLEYNCIADPEAFLRKLEQLNRKRKGGE